MASSPHDHSLNALPPGAVVGDYTIESELGSGGFSIVYLARHHMSGDEPERIWRAAIKEYLPAEVAGRDRDGLTVRPSRSDRQEAFDDGLRRFKEEALHLVRFQRLGNVVDCLNLFEANGTAYLVMEYDDGLPLSTFLQLREEQGRPCSENDLMAVMEPLLKCLSEVHRARVYHRDIKPGNIFVRRADDVLGRPAEPMLLDFGAAKLDYLATHSRSGAPYTPGYAPLEQTSSIGEMGPWTDIYALGATMWRMVAGGSGDSRLNAPEDSVDPLPGTRNPTPVDAQKRLAAMNWRPPRPDPMPSAADLGAGRISTHVLAAIDRCLSLYPEDRPQHCEELRDMLRGAVDAGVESDAADSGGASDRQDPAERAGADVGAASAGPQATVSRSRRRGMGLGLAAGIVAVLGLVAYLSGEFAPDDLKAVPFTVETDPPGASVRILNIAERYVPGMELPAGEYRLEASAEGYETTAEIVHHGPAGAMEHSIALSRAARRHGDRFRDCADCPEMVVIPAGEFRMGCVSGQNCADRERPVHEVRIGAPFALSVREVTRGQFRRFVDATSHRMSGGCSVLDDDDWQRRDDRGWLNPGFEQTDDHPVACVSWDDAGAYASWLSRQTGERYRLPSESEWEYAARAGSTAKYHFGNDESELCRYGNHADASTDFDWSSKSCSDGVGEMTAPVGSYEANGFGLHDMHGNVWEWAGDCWNRSYAGAPADGSAWLSGDCGQRVLRGGTWVDDPRFLRTAYRFRRTAGSRIDNIGFRVARTLAP